MVPEPGILVARARAGVRDCRMGTIHVARAKFARLGVKPDREHTIYQDGTEPCEDPVPRPRAFAVVLIAVDTPSGRPT